jgi:hypothetical protein
MSVLWIVEQGGLIMVDSCLCECEEDNCSEQQIAALECDLDEIDKKGHFISWDKAKKKFGLK